MKQVFLYFIYFFIYWISFLIPRNRNLWIFNSYGGKKYYDSSRILFEYINENYKEIDTFFLCRNKKVFDKITSNGYKAAYIFSLKGILLILRAKVSIITHNGVIDSIFNNPNIVLVQLWHGFSLKKVGFDDMIFSKKENISIIKKILFPFIKENYSMIISLSEEVSKNLITAFRIDPKKVKVTGYPRNDIIFTKRNKEYEFKRVIYMPTFRGMIENQEVDLFTPYGFNIDKINSFLEENKIKLYFKMHPFNRPSKELLNKIKDSKFIKFYDKDEIYEDLNSFDCLITDYSSIYLDYILLDRPIIFACFDKEDYMKKERNLYYDYDEVTPGLKVMNWNEVLNAIKRSLENPNEFKEERNKITKMFHKYIDGNSSERVYQEIKKLL